MKMEGSNRDNLLEKRWIVGLDWGTEGSDGGWREEG
jgi:hypothetical protein